jgi:4-diphosphocytidyl-2-C-methyl-D-erythritol kinase
MERIDVDLSDYYFVLVYPQIHVSTAETFKALSTQRSAYNMSLKQIVALPVSEWKNSLVNEFEVPVFERFPEISQIKQSLYDAGAEYASMTGTGSSVYGIFHHTKKTGNLKMPENYRVFNLKQSQ